MATIDTTDLEVSDTTVVLLDDKHGNELCDASGNRRSVTLWGPGSTQFQQAKAENNVRNMKRIRNKGGRDKADPEGDVAAVAAFLSSITISFNNFGLSDEDQTKQTFRELFMNTKVGYITDKVNSEAGDWGNF